MFASFLLFFVLKQKKYLKKIQKSVDF